jgi:hypothetical protein
VKTRLLVAMAVALLATMFTPALAQARTLSPGMCGAGVFAQQVRLYNRSYLPVGYHPGCYDYRTTQAVMAFQGWVRFSRTGIATDLVQRRLAMSIRPHASATWPFKHIEVHKSRQVALLIGRGGLVVRTVHVSTARPGYTTPVGRFRVYAKARMSWSIPYQVWLPWASYVVGGIAFHSYPSVPGYPASHGCIRVPAPEAVMLYYYAPIGTPVWILA